MTIRPLWFCLVGTLLLAGLVASGRGHGAASATGAPTPPDFAVDELLVAFKDDASLPERQAALDSAGVDVIDVYALSGIQRLRVPSRQLGQAQQALLASGVVRFAEPNYRLQVAQLVPDDPLYGPDQSWYFDLMGAADAWTTTTGSRAVVVAIIDGAVDLDHPDLAPNIWTNDDEIPDNGVDDDGNGYIDDVHGYDWVGDWPGGGGAPSRDSDPDAKLGDPAVGDGLDQDGDGEPDGAVGHGTKVAGIVGAVGNNALGVAGVAWRVSIMPLRVTSPEGDGFFSSFVAALEYAVANGADVANVSLVSSMLPLSTRTAVEAATAAGLIIVGAAGNSGFATEFPAALPDIIAVGAHGGRDAPDTRAFFSPWGAGIEFVAAGVDVATTDVLAVSGEASYGTGTGTSFSAPIVSGAAALILSLAPAADLEDVRAFLRAGAVDLPDFDAQNWDGGLRGGGRLHLRATLAAVASGPPGAPLFTQATRAITTLEVRGVAEPRSTVTISTAADGATIATVESDADGRFTVRIPFQHFEETVATVELVAVVENVRGRSPPSTPFEVALIHSEVLYNGWNLVTWAGPTEPSATVLAGLPPTVKQVFAWNGTTWAVAIPGNPFFSIAAIRTGQPLWVYVETILPITWRQVRAPYEPPQLQSGWQLIAWTGGDGDVQSVAAATAAEIVGIFAWDVVPQRFQVFRPQQPLVVNTLTALQHFQPVWVLVGTAAGRWPE